MHFFQAFRTIFVDSGSRNVTGEEKKAEMQPSHSPTGFLNLIDINLKERTLFSAVSLLLNTSFNYFILKALNLFCGNKCVPVFIVKHLLEMLCFINSSFTWQNKLQLTVTDLSISDKKRTGK